MTRFSVATFVAVTTLTFTSESGVAAQKVRALRPNGQAIVSRLLADDQVVVIESVMPSYGPPFKMTRENELSALNRWEEVAVIHQAQSHSFFVRNGTWLNTRVTARVVQTLKTSKLAIGPGTVIAFEHEGGELEVNGVTVRSNVGVFFENSTRVKAHRNEVPDLQKWQVVVMFELDDLDVLRGARRRDGSIPESTLHGLSVIDVANALSRSAQ